METKKQEEVKILHEQLGIALARLAVAVRKNDREWLETYIHATVQRLKERGVNVTK